MCYYALSGNGLKSLHTQPKCLLWIYILLLEQLASLCLALISKEDSNAERHVVYSKLFAPPLKGMTDTWKKSLSLSSPMVNLPSTTYVCNNTHRGKDWL